EWRELWDSEGLVGGQGARRDLEPGQVAQGAAQGLHPPPPLLGPGLPRARAAPLEAALYNRR
ncbi:MAG: hypothetical protein VX938_06450, partial [Myxococcota bacterium]|nr:hypothetical protein [Myxococcota bacterium]